MTAPPTPHRAPTSPLHPKAADEVFERLVGALRPKIARKAAGFRVLRHDLPDAVADTLAHVLIRMRATPSLPDDPLAWACTVAQNRLTDLARQAGRRPSARSDGFDDASEPAADAFVATRHALDREVDGRREARRFARALDEYVAWADREARRGHQVRTWFETRFGERDADAVAVDLAARLGRPVGADLVWKWSERGKALVRALASADSDRRRGEMMRAVADGCDRRTG